MATFLQMIDNVYAVLRDTERVYVKVEEVQTWLNEAYLDICVRLGLTEESASGTTTATGTVALPADFVRLLAFYVDTEDSAQKERVEMVNDDIFLNWENSAYSPGTTIGRIFEGNIETYPAVVSDGYTLEYIEKPIALAAAADTPVVPEELHIRLVNYARAHAKWKEGELEEGNLYWMLYLDNLPQAPDARERKTPGPITVVPQIGYWDL